EVRRLTNGEGVDIVVEHVGSATWESSVRSLRRGGTLVTCGATTGPDGILNIRYLFARQLTILGSYMGGSVDLQHALSFFPSRKLRPIVDSVFELKDAAEAQRRMESREHFGKIVLKVP
ncbi:MAG: zinc-binding dehydrogenase, partial [Candidatus Geothermarchaeales archaeon]